MVGGSPVANVKLGDFVKVTCRARGGNPVPDVGLLLDGEHHSGAGHKFRQFRNSFTFVASEEFNGRTVGCIVRNKMGQTFTEKTITVLSKCPLKIHFVNKHFISQIFPIFLMSFINMSIMFLIVQVLPHLWSWQDR